MRSVLTKFILALMFSLSIQRVSPFAITARSFHFALCSSLNRLPPYSLISASSRLSSSSSSPSLPLLSPKRILFLGTPPVAATFMESLHASSLTSASSSIPYEIVGVVTQPQRPSGRGKKLTPSAVESSARNIFNTSIPILTPPSAKDPTYSDFISAVTTLNPDICITVAYGEYLPKKFLTIPPLGTINVHPSLLPRWRGASPVQRSLENLDEKLGVSLLYTVKAMDSGPIVAQIEVNDDGNKGGHSYWLPQLMNVGCKELISILPKVFNHELSFDSALVQNNNHITHANLIEKSEGVLNFNTSTAQSCLGKIRGFDLWPGTWFFVNIVDASGNCRVVKLKVAKGRVVENKVGGDFNDKNLTMGDNGVFEITCFDGSVLEINEVQPEGKKAMAVKAFVNGLRGGRVEWV